MNHWLLTAEHAGNQVPNEWAHLFRGKVQVLETHEGFDLGTLALTRHLSSLADATFIYPYTRLLIEVNRSLGHPKLFSAFTKPLSRSDKQQIIDRFYKPHWNAVEQQIRQWTAQCDTVFHIGIHSFTPVLNGNVRNTDIGLLYDPRRKPEKSWAEAWKMLLEQTGLKVRRNYPYLGTADGLITQMRRKFPKCYHGIELEINQRFVDFHGAFSDIISHTVYHSLLELKK